MSVVMASLTDAGCVAGEIRSTGVAVAVGVSVGAAGVAVAVSLGVGVSLGATGVSVGVSVTVGVSLGVGVSVGPICGLMPGGASNPAGTPRGATAAAIARDGLSWRGKAITRAIRLAAMQSVPAEIADEMKRRRVRGRACLLSYVEADLVIALWTDRVAAVPPP